MSYTPAQAKRLATQILTRFGPLLAAAATPLVPEDFLAGFLGVECGKDKRGRLVPEATRFEPHVYAALKSIRDTGSRNGKTHYNRIFQKDLKGRSDAELRELATSHGPAQIMGWHLIRNLPQFSIADLSDPSRMFEPIVALLVVVAKDELRAGRLSNALRIWNTGKPDGKTFHEDYVPNAQAVSAAYRLARAVGSEVSLQPSADSPQSGSATADPINGPTPGPAPDSDGAQKPADSAGEQKTSIEISGSGPTFNVLSQAGTAVDGLEKVVNEIGKRADSVKSIRATIGGSIYQILVAIAGIFLGIPREIWITVLIFGGLLFLAYLIRQIYLGGIREKKA